MSLSVNSSYRWGVCLAGMVPFAMSRGAAVLLGGQIDALHTSQRDHLERSSGLDRDVIDLQGPREEVKRKIRASIPRNALPDGVLKEILSRSEAGLYSLGQLAAIRGMSLAALTALSRMVPSFPPVVTVIGGHHDTEAGIDWFIEQTDRFLEVRDASRGIVYWMENTSPPRMPDTLPGLQAKFPIVDSAMTWFDIVCAEQPPAQAVRFLKGRFEEYRRTDRSFEAMLTDPDCTIDLFSRRIYEHLQSAVPSGSFHMIQEDAPFETYFDWIRSAVLFDSVIFDLLAAGNARGAYDTASLAAEYYFRCLSVRDYSLARLITSDHMRRPAVRHLVIRGGGHVPALMKELSLRCIPAECSVDREMHPTRVTKILDRYAFFGVGKVNPKTATWRRMVLELLMFNGLGGMPVSWDGPDSPMLAEDITGLLPLPLLERWFTECAPHLRAQELPEIRDPILSWLGRQPELLEWVEAGR